MTWTAILCGLGWAWAWLVIRRPLAAFLTVLMVWALAYSRLGLSLFQVEGPGNRGALALGDVLWLSYVGIWVVRAMVTGRLWRPAFALPKPMWVGAPFIGLATLLPILGVGFGNWPLSYSLPGFRQLQWVSFAFIAAALGRQYSMEQRLQGILSVLCAAGVAHMLYSLVQLGYFFGVIGRIWVILDDLYAAQHPLSWFFYPRTTGWLVDPNGYGVFCALLMIAAIALYLAGSARQWRRQWWLIVITASFGLAFSGSRTALLGLAAALFVMIGLAFAHRPLARRLTVGLGITGMGGSLTLAMLWPVLPVVLQERFVNLLGVLSTGVAADRNALARAEEWQYLWRLYESAYPLGTWVPSSYATGSFVDSFYVFTALQGTPVLTLSWLLGLAAMVLFGWTAYGRAESLCEAACGLALAGWAGMLAGSSLSLSPMLMPQVIAPFWSVIGVLVSARPQLGNASVRWVGQG